MLKNLQKLNKKQTNEENHWLSLERKARKVQGLGDRRRGDKRKCGLLYTGGSCWWQSNVFMSINTVTACTFVLYPVILETITYLLVRMHTKHMLFQNSCIVNILGKSYVLNIILRLPPFPFLTSSWPCWSSGSLYILVLILIPCHMYIYNVMYLHEM